MHHYIAWLQQNYSHICRDLAACDHSNSTQDLDPYHLESDCWSHTMMVCKIAELYGYDRTVQLAALLHDIGKPASRKVNPRNNHVQFFGHEEHSAKMAEEVLVSMIKEEMLSLQQKNEIIKLVKNHSFLHGNLDSERLLKRFGDHRAFCIHLIQLSRCDAMGRFCIDMFDDDPYQRLLSALCKK